MPQWRASDVVCLAAIIALVGGLVMAMQSLQYSIGLNDFFGLSFAGEHWSWADPQTWRNGFYPALSIYYFHLLGDQAPRLALLFNAQDAALMFASIYIVGRGRARGFSGLTAALLLFALPSVVTITLTQTADLAAMAGVAVALAAVDYDTNVRSGESGNWGVHATILAAIAAFLAVQMRLHTITLLLPAGLAGLALMAGRRRAWAALAGGSAAGGALQAAVNLAAGYPPLHTSQAFNLYRTIHPINWLQTSQLTEIPGPAALIAADPAAVTQAWLQGALTMWVPLVAAIIAVVCVAAPVLSSARSSHDKRTALAIAGGVLVYVAAVSLGGSERGVLALWAPAIMLGLMCFGRRRGSVQDSKEARAATTGEKPALPLFLLAAAIAVGASVAPPAARTHVEGRLQTWQLSTQIEEILVNELGVRSSTDVFSEEFDFYLPNTPPYWTHHLGGWSRVDLHGFNEASPELCVTSVECLYTSAGAAGVRILVLGPRANLAGLALGQLHEQPTASQSRFVPIGAIAGMIIFVRQPEGGS